jgi:hypothetical protein
MHQSGTAGARVSTAREVIMGWQAEASTGIQTRHSRGLRTKENRISSRTCKPNSVCRIAPAGRSFLWARHYCRAQATYPEVVTHRAGTCPGPKSQAPSLFGLAPCGVCPARGITVAAVRSYRTFSPLPRASLRRTRRYVFCGTFRRANLNPPSRTLSGTLLCGVRTFLPHRPKAAPATVRSGCQRTHYMRFATLGCFQARGRAAAQVCAPPDRPPPPVKLNQVGQN